MNEKGPLRVALVEDRWTTARHVVETIAIVAAGLWALYTFVYEERIKPASEPAALDIAVSFHRLGRDATRDIVVFRTEYHDSGKTEFDIAADGFTVWGVRYGQRRAVHAAYESQPQSRGFHDDVPVVARKILVTFAELRGAAVGGPDRHIVLEPGITLAVERTITVRRGEFDSLIGTAVAIPMKTPVTRKADIEIERIASGAYWLRSNGPTQEDDNQSEFALIP